MAIADNVCSEKIALEMQTSKQTTIKCHPQNYLNRSKIVCWSKEENKILDWKWQFEKGGDEVMKFTLAEHSIDELVFYFAANLNFVEIIAAQICNLEMFYVVCTL